MSIFDKFRSDEPDIVAEDTTDPERIEGKIIKISPEGWGFISSKAIPFTRIFFHWTSLNQNTLNFKELETGMMVEFIPIEVENKGWRANRVSVLKDE